MDVAPDEEVTVTLSGLNEGARVSWFLMDGTRDMQKIHEDRAHGGCLETIVPMKLFDTLLLRVDGCQ